MEREPENPLLLPLAASSARPQPHTGTPTLKKIRIDTLQIFPKGKHPPCPYFCLLGFVCSVKPRSGFPTRGLASRATACSAFTVKPVTSSVL